MRQSLNLISADAQEIRNDLLTNPSLLPQDRVREMDCNTQTYCVRKIRCHS
jgi:hypothetical protein